MVDGPPRLGALTGGNEWDFQYEKDPRCPHCGSSHRIQDTEWWSLYEEGEHEVECPTCEMSFMVSTHVSHSFSTDEQDAQP